MIDSCAGTGTGGRPAAERRHAPRGDPQRVPFRQGQPQQAVPRYWFLL